MTYADGRTVEYTYDKEERITKIVDSVDGIRDYAYDSLGQLTSEKIGNTTTNITYDKYGNILTKGGVSYGYGLSSANPWRDRLTSYNGQAISYDANGNPTSYRGLNLVWEKGRQLKSAGNNTFKYNSNGIRTHKNGKKYTLDGAKILREEWSGNKIEFLYDHEDAIIGIIFNQNAYYFIKNLQGDVISLANSAGNVVANYSYDAWGRVLSVTGSEAAGIGAVNPIRYRGYYYDTETQWYYLNSRYYDPTVGRFVNADEVETIGLSLENVFYVNLYSYCENNPIMNVDETGMFSFKAIWDFMKTALKSIVGGLKSIYKQRVANVDAQLTLRKGADPRKPLLARHDALSKKMKFLGKIGIIISIIVIVVSIAFIVHGFSTGEIRSIHQVIAGLLITGLIALISWGISSFAKLLPGGIVIAKLGSIAISTALSFWINKSRRDRIENEYARRMEGRIGDYSQVGMPWLVEFFSSISAAF